MTSAQLLGYQASLARGEKAGTNPDVCEMYDPGIMRGVNQQIKV